MPDGLIDAEIRKSTPDETDISGLQRSQQTGRPDIPHITDRFIPVSHIVAALTRTSYIHLLQLRDAVADAPDQKRKRRIVEYANKFRAEYVKLLVLVSWASRADDVSAAIDLRAWLQGQKNCFDNLCATLKFDVLRNLESAKIPEPDLSSAIQVLTTGSITNFGSADLVRQFRKIPPLGPDKILRTLRTLNSLISLRLLLHEHLPLVFQNYTVASGRATFAVPSEFSIDLFFAREDIDSDDLQWFMIDFRFAFGEENHVETPVSLKLEIENISNALMARVQSEKSGKHQLVELYNFLHKFTIQYKLERLFNQFSLIGNREKGQLDLKYASAQKVLVVGYWLQKRHRENKGVLNSMTITIEDRKVGAKERILATERLTCDYNCERLTLKVRLDEEETVLENVDAGRDTASGLLSTVIGIRTEIMLQNLRRSVSAEDLPFTRESNVSSGKSLQVRLDNRTKLDISVDSFDGNFVVCIQTECQGTVNRSAPTNIARLQQALNSGSQPRSQALLIHEYKFNFIRNSLETTATSTAWTSSRFTASSLDLEEFGRALGSENRMTTLGSCVFLTRLQEGWKNTNGGSSWFIVIVIQPAGLTFWLAELVVDEARGKWKIQWVERVNFEAQTGPVSFDQYITCQSFERLWHLSSARIISLQISRGFGDRNIDHRYRRPLQLSTWASLDIPNICFAAEDVTYSKAPWTEPIVTVALSDLCIDATGGAIVSFRCRKVRGLEFDLGQCGDLTVHAGPSVEDFEIKFKATVAQPSNLIVDLFCNKWRMVENTINILEAASTSMMQFQLQSATLSVVSFLYGAEQSDILQLHQEPALLGDAIDILVVLGSMTNKANPHLRIAEKLGVIATRYQSDPKILFKIMALTYPVLDTLGRLEQGSFSSPEFYVMVRAAEEYRLYYPRKGIALLLRARPAPKRESLPEQYRKLKDSALWHFTDASRSSSAAVHGQHRIYSCDQIFNEGLNELLQTDQTFPEGSGIGCTRDLAAQVLSEVHKRIMEQQLPPDVAPPPKVKGRQNTGTQTAPSKSRKASSATKSRSGEHKVKGGANAGEVIEIL